MRKITKDAFVMIGHCPKEKGIYGITVDKVSLGHYVFVWAFRLNREKAKNEGFGMTTVKGSIMDDEEYPGCPYCGTKNKVICHCGAVLCYYGESYITCPNCGASGNVTYTNTFNLKGGAM